MKACCTTGRTHCQVLWKRATHPQEDPGGKTFEQKLYTTTFEKKKAKDKAAIGTHSNSLFNIMAAAPNGYVFMQVNVVTGWCLRELSSGRQNKLQKGQNEHRDKRAQTFLQFLKMVNLIKIELLFFKARGERGMYQCCDTHTPHRKGCISAVIPTLHVTSFLIYQAEWIVDKVSTWGTLCLEGLLSCWILCSILFQLDSIFSLLILWAWFT